jgi:cathepsin B
MKFAFAFIAGAEAASFADIAAEVNAQATTWTAQAPSKFETPEDVKAYLGAFLPGDAEYEEVGPERTEYSDVELPDSFDSAEQWPQCSVITNVRDQSSCGSCWAFGSVSSFEARACIATGKDVKYSPEQTAFCFNSDGCGGGNNVWGKFKSTGVVSGGDYTDNEGETCARYSLKPCAHHVPGDEKYQPCPSSEYHSPTCPTACEDGYNVTFSADKLHAASTYGVRGEENMMKDLVENGPMYVSFTVYDDFPTYRSGVYKHTSRKFLGGHAVTLVGYGELDGQKYWKIKNSWNENWGNNGHFLIARGNNECGIESGAGAGTIASTIVSSAQGDHHYEAPPCQDDEVAARLSGGGGALCAAHCGDDGSCSQDFPEDVQNPQPQCILQDQSGNKYCALTCGFRSGGDCPSGATCTSGVCAYNSTDAATTILEKQDADFSQLVCKDRKCSAECETESYTFSDCLPVVGGGSARGVSCCDNPACVVQGSDFGLQLDVYRSDDCTGSSQRMKQPVTQCLHTSSGDSKFAKFVCGGNYSSAARISSELNLQSPTFEYV